MFKNIKKWKTIIHYIITILTAIASSIATQSCMGENIAQKCYAVWDNGTQESRIAEESVYNPFNGCKDIVGIEVDQQSDMLVHQSEIG